MQLFEEECLKTLTRTRREERRRASIPKTLYVGSRYHLYDLDKRAATYQTWVDTYVKQSPALFLETRLKTFQHNRCYLCNRPFCYELGALVLPTKEHVTPRARGGTTPRNVLLACKPCNMAKADRRPTNNELWLCEAFYRIDSGET